MPDAERPFRAPLNLQVFGATQPLTAVLGALLSSLALVSVAAWPAGQALAERSCDEWSATITAVEGNAELRRNN